MKRIAVFTLILISIISLCTILCNPIWVHAQTNVITTATVTPEPNLVEVNQMIVVVLRIEPPPPSSSDLFSNVTVTFINPNLVKTYNTYFSVGGSYGFSYTPSLAGNWILQLNFPGQTFANGTIHYLPSENQTTLTVLPQPSPATVGSWTEKTPMPTPRLDLGVAAVNGKIYAIGGSNQRTPLATNEMYDPSTDTWTTKASMPTPRIGFGISVYQNKIYCIGGVEGPNNTASGANEVYDPATDTWQTKTPIPIPGVVQANVADGKIFLLSILNQVYDPRTDTWTKKASVPTGMDAYVSASVDDKICLFQGGSTPSIPYAIYYGWSPLTYIYNTQNDSWSNGAQIPDKAYEQFLGGAAATTGQCAPKRIYVIGGYGGGLPDNGQTILNEVQIYNPESNSWTTGVSMPTRRTGLGIAVLNDTLYAIGGGYQDGWGATNANEQYTPPGYGTPDPTYQTPSPSPSTSQSPTPSPIPSLSKPPTASPTPTTAPSSPTATQQPTPSNSAPTGSNNTSLQANVFWIAAATAILVVGLIAVVAILKKKQSPQNTKQIN